jgi:hypothetical protein
LVRHGSNLSRFGASGKPGAVQIATRFGTFKCLSRRPVEFPALNCAIDTIPLPAEEGMRYPKAAFRTFPSDLRVSVVRRRHIRRLSSRTSRCQVFNGADSKYIAKFCWWLAKRPSQAIWTAAEWRGSCVRSRTFLRFDPISTISILGASLRYPNFCSPLAFSGNSKSVYAWLAVKTALKGHFSEPLPHNDHLSASEQMNGSEVCQARRPDRRPFLD